MRSQKTPGTFSSFRPKKSFTCVLAIRMAMPLVNPITMGRGMYFTAAPMPVSPMTTRMRPAITVHMNRPSTPCEGDNAGDDDHECSGRAANLGRRSAEHGNQKTGDDGAVDSGLRREARSDRESHGQRQSDQAYGDAGDQIAQRTY